MQGSDNHVADFSVNGGTDMLHAEIIIGVLSKQQEFKMLWNYLKNNTKEDDTIQQITHDERLK